MKNSPAVDVMYEDMIREKGKLWLYGAVLKVLPGVILELIPIWFKTRQRSKLLPFLEFEPLLDRSLLDIRQEFDLLPFIKQKAILPSHDWQNGLLFLEGGM